MSESPLLNKLREAELLNYGSRKLRGGDMSDIYADIKKAYGQPEILSHVARVMLRKMDVRTTSIAASGHGGLPLATAMSLQSELPVSFVRDREKGHALDKLIDGYTPNAGGLVTLVDDVFMTGSSLLGTASTIESTGAQVLECDVVVARADASDFRYHVLSLFTLEDLQAS